MSQKIYLLTPHYILYLSLAELFAKIKTRKRQTERKEQGKKEENSEKKPPIVDYWANNL